MKTQLTPFYVAGILFLLSSHVFGQEALLTYPIPGSVAALTIMSPTNNPLGLPIASTSANEMLNGIASDGTNILAIIQVMPSPKPITAQLIDPDGKAIGNPIVFSRTGYRALAAFDGRQYLVVWEDALTEDIYGQFVTRAGELAGDPFAITTAPGKQSFDSMRAILFDGTDYLVVWRDERNQNDFDGYGQWISPSGALVGGEFAFSQQPGNLRSPSVASDGVNVFVVWLNRQTTSLFDVWGRFIGKNGVVGDPIPISQIPTPRFTGVRVGYNSGNYLVVWNHDLSAGSPNPASWAVNTRRVSKSDVLSETVIPAQANASGYASAYTYVSISSLEGGFLAYWLEDFDSAKATVKGQFFTSDGTRQGPVIILTEPSGERIPLMAVWPQANRLLLLASWGRITMDANGQATYTDGDVYGQIIPWSPGSRFLEQPGLSQLYPMVTLTNKAIAGGAAFDGKNYLMGVQIDAAFARANPTAQIAAQFAGRHGTVTEPLIDIGRNGSPPLVAFGANRYLLVWSEPSSNTTNIQGQFLSTTGSKLGAPFLIRQDAAMRNMGGIFFNGALTFDGDHFLVVWEDRSGPAAAILAQLITIDGQLSGPNPIRIAAGNESQYTPSAMFNGTNHLVVWESRRATTNELYDVMGCLVTRNGVTQSPFVISQNPSPAYNPASIAFDGSRHWVVWNRDQGPGYPAPSSWDIYGRFVLPEGIPLGEEIPLVTSPGNQVMPQVVYDGKNYLLSWIDGWGSTNFLSPCRYFDTQGRPLGSSFQLFEPVNAMVPLCTYFFNDNHITIGINYVAFGSGGLAAGAIYGSVLPGGQYLPFLTALPATTRGQFRFALNGIPGLSYSVQTATHLPTNTWIDVSTHQLNTPSVELTDPDGNAPRRFYRVIAR